MKKVSRALIIFSLQMDMTSLANCLKYLTLAVDVRTLHIQILLPFLDVETKKG
jgi:hypothetical protein